MGFNADLQARVDAARPKAQAPAPAKKKTAAKKKAPASDDD
jgi:hypothetical protein